MLGEEKEKIFQEMELALYHAKWDQVTSLFYQYGVTFFKDWKDRGSEKVGIGLLCHLVCFEKEELIKLIIENGWDVNETDRNGDTVLYTLAIYGGLEMLEYFIEKGLDIHHRDHGGETGLMAACSYSNFEEAKLLYEIGVDPNICNEKGENCFYSFRYEKEDEMKWVEMFLQYPERLNEENLKFLKAKRLASIYK